MPSVQALFSDSELVNIMDFEMGAKIIPLMDNQAEEYFVTLADIPYNQSVTTYSLPVRATADKLRAVSFVDANNNEIRIPRLRPEDIMSNVNSTGLAINPALWGFYLENDKCKLYLGSFTGSSNSYKFLRLRFIRMPNTLVLSTACGQITAIAGNVVTVSNVPATFVTGTTYDIVSNSPQMFVSQGDDLVISSVVGSNITFVALPATVQIGDWVCLAMQSPIPQIPFKVGFQFLLQLAAAKCLEIHADAQGYNVAMSQAADMKTLFISMITPRVDGNVIRLTTANSLYGWD